MSANADWSAYLERALGFVLPKSQENWLTLALMRICRRMDIDSQALLTLAKQNAGVRQMVFDEVLIGETRFFRDMPSLAFVAQAFAEHRKSMPERAFRVWCAGVATGQEAWSLAMLLSTHRVGAHDINAYSNHYQITGSDANQRAVQSASVGVYKEIPPQYAQFFKEGRIDKTMLGQVAFVRHNLLDAPLMEQLNAILCQNVLIYFRRFDARDILAGFVSALQSGGVLVLGQGEMIGWSHPQMVRVSANNVNAWQKL